VEQACRLLDQGLAGEDSAGQKVAGQLGMGYESFRKKFVLHLGVSPGRYREHLRIERAKQLLQSKRLTNKELAEMLGFCDEAHFSKTFRRKAGVSPREFRNSLR
jgi:transcriptional regulator GlxA family with amidase domain